MRHRKDTNKLNRTTSHRRCLMANMLKNLIDQGVVETTLPKAKVLKRYADKMITLAKKNTLSSRRRAIAKMMIRYNHYTSKEARMTKEGETKYENADRRVIQELFGVLGPRFKDRQGGYTRIVRTQRRIGDNAQLCMIEYLSD